MTLGEGIILGFLVMVQWTLVDIKMILKDMKDRRP